MMTETTQAVSQHRVLIVFTVLLGMFCASMEAMVTATLLPSIIASFEGFELYPWVSSSYLLASVAAGPLFGALADIYGYRRVYAVAVFVFLMGSMLCGLSSSMMELIGARAIQGIGSAGLITLSIVLFGVVFPAEKRAKMQALISGTWAISSIVGPTVGALAVEYLSWRWAFFINIPAALIILVAVPRFGQLTSGRPNRRLDWKGAVLFCLGTLAMVGALLRLGQLKGGALELAMVLTGVFFLAAFVRHLRLSDDPLIPMALIRRRVTRVSVLQIALVGGLLFSLVNFLPLFVQGVMGLPPRTAGWVVTCCALGMFGGSLLSGLFLNRVGFRKMATCGGALVVLGFAALAMILKGAAVWQLVTSNLVIGAGLAMVGNAVIVAMQAIASDQTMGAASSLLQFFRMSGGTVVIALMGGVQLGAFRRRMDIWQGYESLPLAARQVLDSPQKIFDPIERQAIGPELLAPLSDSLLFSLHEVFLFCLVLGGVLWFLASRMPNVSPKQLAENSLDSQQSK